MILVVTPLAALFMRRRPEDLDLLPDGDSVPVTQSETDQTERTETEYSWTLREALKTRALWVLLGVQVLMSMSLTHVLFHHVAYIQDKGYSLAQAATIATTLAFFALIAKVPWGYLVERVQSRWLLGFCLIPNGLCLLLLVWAQNGQMLFAYAAINGFMIGGQGPLLNVAWASYFGRQQVGAIRGLTTPVGQVVGSFSRMFAAWTWTPENSYSFSFLVFSFIYVAAGLLMLTASSPGAPPTVLAEEGER